MQLYNYYMGKHFRSSLGIVFGYICRPNPVYYVASQQYCAVLGGFKWLKVMQHLTEFEGHNKDWWDFIVCVEETQPGFIFQGLALMGQHNIRLQIFNKSGPLDWLLLYSLPSILKY